MTDLPAAAIDAAFAAISMGWDIPTPATMKRILEAAAPHITAAEREACIKLTLFHAEQLSGGAMDYEASLFRDFAGLLREDTP